MRQHLIWRVAVPWLLASASQAGTVGPVFSDGFEDRCGQIIYSEDFALPNGADWPSPWQAIGNVALADISGGAARLRPGATGYSLARIYAPITVRDVEVRFTFRLEDEPTQGVGFYVRSNVGYLTETSPPGEGYAVFAEGSFRGKPGIGVWKEQNGQEIEMNHSGAAAPPPQAGVDYRVRLRVHQQTPTETRVEAKMWAVGALEPLAWQASFADATPSLQNISGGIAVDSWSVRTTDPISAHTLVDDIEIAPLCSPLDAGAVPQWVAESFQFAEGPLWRGDHLLFSDSTGRGSPGR